MHDLTEEIAQQMINCAPDDLERLETEITDAEDPPCHPIARAIHCIVISAIVIIMMMWTSDYVNLLIDIKAAERQRSQQPADSQRAPHAAPTACQR